MKLRHWLILGFILIGLLFVAHIYLSHGGTSGFLSGLGLSGNGSNLRSVA